MTEGLCLVFANLKPRKLASIKSEGMVLCASSADHSIVELMRPPAGAKVGERVQLEGNPINGEPLKNDFQAVLNPKRKVPEKLLPLLKTDADRQATYNGIKLTTSAGPITAATLANSSIS